MTDWAEYVSGLTDEELYEELKSNGVPVGPVTDSTRRLYESRLVALLKCNKSSGDASVEETSGTRSTPRKQPKKAWSAHTAPIMPQIDKGSMGSGDTPKRSMAVDHESKGLLASGDTPSTSTTGRSRSMMDMPIVPQLSYIPPKHILEQDPKLRFRRATDKPQESHDTVGHPRLLPAKPAYDITTQLWILSFIVAFAAAIMTYVYYQWKREDPFEQMEEKAHSLMEEEPKNGE